MSPGAVTALVDRLEKGRHVERVPNPGDRRSLLLRATPSGVQAMIGQVLPLAGDIDGLAAGLSEEERRAVERFVQGATAATMRRARVEDSGSGVAGRDL